MTLREKGMCRWETVFITTLRVYPFYLFHFELFDTLRQFVLSHKSFFRIFCRLGKQ